jgi:lipopolysaccharide/colanic/teichoic acid biosynthesis glycosyltransferase
VRPGVTGLAQINGRKDIQWDKRIEYDVQYVDNISINLDLKIFMKTIAKVLTMQDNVNIGSTVRSNTINVEKNKKSDLNN